MWHIHTDLQSDGHGNVLLTFYQTDTVSNSLSGLWAIPLTGQRYPRPDTYAHSDERRLSINNGTATDQPIGGRGAGEYNSIAVVSDDAAPRTGQPVPPGVFRGWHGTFYPSYATATGSAVVQGFRAPTGGM